MRFLVWGAGGHGRVVADVVRAAGHVVHGYVDADVRKLEREIDPAGARMVIAQEELLRILRSDHRVPDGIDAIALGLGANELRSRFLVDLDGLPLPPIVHPSAIVSDSAILGRGTVVCPGAVINTGARVGSGVIVNTGAIIEHDCEIGDAAHLAPRSVLGGGVRLGQRAWIGLGATVVQNLAIGADAVVGAGAAVIRDVPEGSTVVGVPARNITKAHHAS